MNRFDLPDDLAPKALSIINEAGIASIPDYAGYSNDGKYCALGEAKTEFRGQTIYDKRADRQLRAYMKWLTYYDDSLLLIAVPNNHVRIAKLDVRTISKEIGFQGEILYFNFDGLVQ
jgi:hypothetical protein